LRFLGWWRSLTTAVNDCASEGHLSGEEFVLFVSRARTHSDLQQTIDRIMAWRGLPNIKQNEILGALQNTNYDTIERDHSYSMAFHHCDLFLHRGQGGLYVEGVDIDKRKRRLAKHQGVSEIIEFRNEPDYIASLGDTEGKGTQIDALDYYIDVSDVKNAVKVYRKLPKAVRGEMTPEEFEEAQFLEEHLEDHLEDHLDKIEPGLKLIGRQLSTKVGPIDLFAEAKNGDLVVLELKKGRAPPTKYSARSAVTWAASRRSSPRKIQRRCAATSSAARSTKNCDTPRRSWMTGSSDCRSLSLRARRARKTGFRSSVPSSSGARKLYPRPTNPGYTAPIPRP
jgi:Holliday junction resolvase-like predicted endonuclease